MDHTNKSDVKFTKYFVAGVGAAACEYGVFILSHYLLNGGLLLSQVISFLVGFMVSFILNSIWVFNSINNNRQRKKLYWSRLIPYGLLAFINIVITSIVILILQKMKINPLVAKIIVMGLVMTWNFMIFNKIIFTEKFLQKITPHNLKVELAKMKGSFSLFFILLLIGLVYIFITPPIVGHDEYAHIIKADSTSRLDFIPKKMSWTKPAGEEEVFYAYRASDSLVYYSGIGYSARNEFKDKEVVKKITTAGVEKYNSATNYHDAYGAAGYHSIGYMPSAVGFKLARMFDLNVKDTVILARISTLITHALIIAAAFQVLYKSRLRYVVLFISLFPPILFNFTAISADGLLNSISILFMSLLLVIMIKNKNEKREWSWEYILAVLCAVALPLIKLPYMMISLLILFTRNTSSKVEFNKKTIIIKSIVLAMIVMPAILWTSIASSPNQLQSTRVFSGQMVPNQEEQVKYIVTNPLGYATLGINKLINLDMIGQVGRVTQLVDDNYMQNKDLITAYLMMLVLVGVYIHKDVMTLYRKNKTFFIALGSSTVLTVLGIITALYVAANSVGNEEIWGIQPRYFLPLASSALILGGLLISGVKQTEYIKSIRVMLISAIIINIIVLCAYVWNIS